MNIYYCTLIGLVLTVVIVIITEYYTGIYGPVKRHRRGFHHRPRHPTSSPAWQSPCRPPQRPFWPSVWPSIWHTPFAGLYGIAMAAMSMLSMTGMVIAIDAYGPITDNAGGIAEMAGMDESVRAVTDPAGRRGQHHQGPLPRAMPSAPQVWPRWSSLPPMSRSSCSTGPKEGIPL